MRFSILISFFCIFLFSWHLLVLQGCSNQEEKNTEQQSSVSAIEPVKGGIYYVPLSKTPITLDPVYTKDIYGIALVHQIFDSLVQFDSHLSIRPAIAEKWEIKEEGKLYKFILRKNALFHNMESVTSQDVVFSIKRLLRTKPAPVVLPHLLKIKGAQEYRQGVLENVDGLKIENDKTINIRLEKPHIPFLTALGMYQAAIVPKNEVLRLKDDFGKHPVGSGPFKLVSWDDRSVRLDRFKEYYDGSAHLDGIHYRLYQKGVEPGMSSDFQNSNLEEMAVFGDIKEKLADKKGLQWFHRPSLSLFFYGMNVNHRNLTDPNLRKALSMAVNRQEFVDQVYSGQFDIAKTVLPPGMPGYHISNQIRDNSQDLARQYLEKAFGKTLENLPVLEIVSGHKTPRVVKEMSMMKQYWANIGLTVEPKYITDWNKFEDYIKSDAVQMYRYVWFADIPDPDNFLYPLFASESSSNYVRLKNKNIDEMLSKARSIVEPIERAKFYGIVEAEILEKTPLIPLFHMSIDRVYQPYVRSMEVNALGVHNMQLNKVWLDKSGSN
jgi:ABC-type oligopeptide transport system substrate-binding subunit